MLNRVMYKLLYYFNDLIGLIETIFCWTGTKIKNAANRCDFKLISSQLFRPDHLANGQLPFSPAEPITTIDLRKSMQNGSMISFLDAFA